MLTRRIIRHLSTQSKSDVFNQIRRLKEDPHFKRIFDEMEEKIKKIDPKDIGPPIPAEELERLFDIEKANRIHSVYG